MCNTMCVHVCVVCVAVHISFQKATQTVREDSTSVPLQLQSSGLYGFSFLYYFVVLKSVQLKLKVQSLY